MIEKHTADFVNDPRAKSPIDDPQHWHYRAEEMRTLADGICDEHCRNAMLRNAACYDRLAQHAAGRVAQRAIERARRS